MKGILADINSQGHLDLFMHVWVSDEWREIWEYLQLSVVSFEEMGLIAKAPDDVVWHVCQERQIALLTANRNNEAPDSLEATIRQHNREDSLPVFTIADANRVMNDRDYARRVAEKLLEYLLVIDGVRGTGRMYVP